MTIQELWRRVRGYLGRGPRVDELDEEMRLHLELRARSLRERGMSAEAAERASRLQFGNPVALQEISRDQWRWIPFDAFLQDMRFAMRRVGGNRLANAAIVITLALGIGANTAMFTLLDGVLWKPAPAADPARLAWIDMSAVRTGQSRGLSYPDYVDLRRLGLFEDVAAFTTVPISLGGPAPDRVRGLLVSGNYFDVLGVKAALGRTFRSDEDAAPGTNAVTVLSYSLWTSRLGEDPAVVGRTAVLNGRRFDVIGVAPRGFGGLELEPAALWLPMAMAGEATADGRDALTDRNARWLNVVGRLSRGGSFRQATAGLVGFAREVNRRLSDPDDEVRVAALPIAGGLDPSNRREALPVLSLLAIVPVLVLVVACANAANLLLASGLARRKEFALRRSLGATRLRLVRQLLTESALLAAAGCAAGVAFSHALTAGIVHLASVPPDIAGQLQPSIRVLSASVLLALVSTILVGMVPSWSATNPSLLPSLKDADLAVVVGGSRHRLRDAFVIAQVVVSFVLITVAGLFLRSVSRELHVDPGFDVRNAIVMSFDPDLQGYDRRRREQFKTDLLRDVRALPGVESAALTNALPLAGRMFGAEVHGDPVAAGAPPASASGFFASISPSYLQTMRIALLKGRDFTDQDDKLAPPVAIVNEKMASALWPNASPLGARFRVGRDEPWREVIGVVRTGKYDDYSEPPTPFFYVPDRQWPLGRLSLVVRGTTSASALIAQATRAAHSLDPDLPLFEVSTLDAATRNAVDRQQAASTLIGVFGALALMLATLGLYAVTSQNVTRRTREIAIRMALGAQPGSVVLMFVREGVWLAGIGVAIGLVVGVAISSALASFLFGVGAADAVTYATTAGLFATVSVVASVIPARRAAVVEPLGGLRHE